MRSASGIELAAQPHHVGGATVRGVGGLRRGGLGAARHHQRRQHSGHCAQQRPRLNLGEFFHAGSLPIVCDASSTSRRDAIFLKAALQSVRCSVSRRDRQFLGREQRDQRAALVGDHDLLLDARGRIAVGRRALGLEREHHALLDLGRVIHRHHAADDRPLVQVEAEAVARIAGRTPTIRPGSRTPPPSATPRRCVSVETPGLIRAIALSSHSRHCL